MDASSLSGIPCSAAPHAGETPASTWDAEALRLLADAGEILLASLDDECALGNLARRLVPTLADCCLFDRLLADGSLEAVAEHGADSSQAAVLRPRGEPSCVEPREEGGKYLEEAGLGSALWVPLRVPLREEGRALGVMALAWRPSRGAGDSERALAAEVARLAARSMSNAAQVREARAALTAAEEAGHAKDAFLATVSHELRTPLTSILGWASLLKSGRVDAQTSAHALQTIERNVQAQAQIVGDLLDVSRIIAGKLRLEMSPVALAPIIAAAVESVRPALDAGRITLTQSINDVTVLGDATRLQQVVWNLLSNAAKFTPPDGRVDLSLEVDGSWARLRVADSGPGVPPEFAPHIFERFRQADASPARRHSGLGLGLAIVRHLCEMHGGSVRLEPPVDPLVPGEGAVFVVELPLLAPSPRQEAASAAGQGDYARRVLEGKRIVVAEDKDDSRELLQIVLERFGARVRCVASAAEAAQAIAEEVPDALVCDIAMPGEDGYALMRRLRERFSPEALPALALTAYAAASDRQRALEAGFNAHLPKPASPPDLALAVARLLDQSGEAPPSTCPPT